MVLNIISLKDILSIGTFLLNREKIIYIIKAHVKKNSYVDTTNMLPNFSTRSEYLIANEITHDKHIAIISIINNTFLLLL